MLPNHLKITLRNLLKYKIYSFINITGLAIGLATFLLISLFIAYELSYDRWNPNADRLVRVFTDIKFGGNEMRMAVTGVPIGPDVTREMPEVQNYCRFRNYGSSLVKRDGDLQQNFEERHILTADSTFFELFPIEVIAGTAKTALTNPNTMAISRSRAEKYFGNPQMAMGEALIMDNRRRYQVTAVYEDIPANTHFQADFLVSLNGNREVQQSPPLWAMSNNFHTYLLLRKNTNYQSFTDKFMAFSRKKVAETSKQLMNLSLEDFEKTGQYARFELQKVTDIHLHSSLGVELQPNGSIQYIWVFGAIGLLVLLIACINFMNLTTARSSHRAKEIGVRKVLGSMRGSLISQFLGETVFMTFIAVIFAVLLAALAMPWFNDLTAREIYMPWLSPVFWMCTMLGIGLVGLLAGSYPAFFLSAFDILRVLKGQMTRGAAGSRLRSVLVVFQFATSIILIISTLLVYRQLNYIQNKKLGFQKDQVVIVDNTYVLGDQAKVFKDEILMESGVKSGTISAYLPVPSSRSNTTFTTTREFRQDNAINMQVWTTDEDYLETIGLEMADGRFFDPAFPSDSSAIVLNEAAARILGAEKAAGQQIYYPEADGMPSPEDFRELKVVGIVKDFHWASLRENIGPLCFMLGQSTGLVSFKLEAAEASDIIGKIESTWREMVPNQPFSYRFLDESFAGMYEAEQKIGSIATAFALLAILISCLGLFGLASFTAEQRTKEIGIRKVLGANAGNIVGLLSKDFLKLVAIALVIAIPLSWYGMNRWLQDFAYRININWWVFVIAGLAAVIIAVLSVSYQSIRAAMANPVDALRSE